MMSLVRPHVLPSGCVSNLRHESTNRLNTNGGRTPLRKYDSCARKMGKSDISDI